MSPTVRVGRRLRPVVPPPAERQRLTVDELAERSGLTARTIRSYQTQGILPPPEHHGRVAYYNERHLERLELIAQLKEEGHSLSEIHEVIRRRESRQPSDAPTRVLQPPPPPTSTDVPQRGEVVPAWSPPEDGGRAPAVQGPSPAPSEKTPRRGRRVLSTLLVGLLLVALLTAAMFLLLRDAAADRAQLARQIADLRLEISRLSSTAVTTTTTTTAAPPPAGQPTPASAGPPPTVTVERPVPVPSPAPAPVVVPPPTVVVPPSPPTTQPNCTLRLLGLCV